MKNQEKLNNRILKYLRQRIKDGLTDIAFIKSEEKRAVSIEDYQLAEAIKQALLILDHKQGK